MHTELRFKNLPFSPVQSQVIYIENEYSDVANEFIRTYTRELTRMFAMRGLEFIYFPYLYQDPSLEEKVRYYAPYLQSEITYEELPQSSLLLDCMTSPVDSQSIRPCFIIYGYTDKKEKVFHCWEIDTEAEDMKMDFNRILHEIEDYKDFPGLSHNPNARPRKLSSIVDCSESRKPIPEEPVRSTTPRKRLSLPHTISPMKKQNIPSSDSISFLATTSISNSSSTERRSKSSPQNLSNKRWPILSNN